MVQEVTTQSWGSRLKDAVVGIFVGIILLGVAIYLIFWNESHGLHTAQSLKDAQKQVISIPISPIDDKNNLRVVYLSGLATTTDQLNDPLFNIKMSAIALIRTVEMYQWQENIETKTESQMGGSEKTTKTYTYKKEWSDDLIDSSHFKEQGHDNPAVMPVSSWQQIAPNVTLGDFMLPRELVQKITSSQPINLSQDNLEAFKSTVTRPVQLVDNEIYMGSDAQNPQIGDVRVRESTIIPQIVSVIAQQTGHTLQSYLSPAGETILLLSEGQHSSAEMFHDAQNENRMMTWILRLATLLIMIGGFSLLMKPIVILADVLPIAGTIVGFGTGLIAFVVGLGLWTIFIAIAWFATRPFMAIGLLVIVIGAGYFFIKKRAEKATASSVITLEEHDKK